MRNIILFFLLLATTLSFGQYRERKSTTPDQDFGFSLHIPAKFEIKTPPPMSLSGNFFGHPVYHTFPNMSSNPTPLKGFWSGYTMKNNLSKDGTLQSTYTYDLNGNVVNSKLSYSFKKKH